ncbi:hypothetical protein GT348_00635 [Aristophania vespae]|uniref:Autotransporter domain-containing protein n=1 Tax=Aristophania vespae TaxID=2697033 RepID=A0A6P1NDK1_9PROT|nr:autotransporter-associated beta strand repeat-containing protein [Aristophania vespae]QHI95017.1 hypothetical protein GT348_00635 [Aristophania vespae]
MRSFTANQSFAEKVDSSTAFVEKKLLGIRVKNRCANILSAFLLGGTSLVAVGGASSAIAADNDPADGSQAPLYFYVPKGETGSTEEEMRTPSAFVKDGEGNFVVYSNVRLQALDPNAVFPVNPNDNPSPGAASIQGGTLTIDGSRNVENGGTGNIVAANGYVVVGRGEGSDGTLVIKEQAKLVAGSAQASDKVPSSVGIAQGGGSKGNIKVAGDGSVLLAYGQNGVITVGNGDQQYGQGTANGQLNVSEGGFVYSDRVVAGNYRQGTGVINVSGKGSILAAGGYTMQTPSGQATRLTSNSGLWVNSGGNGTVNVSDNGVLVVQGRIHFGEEGKKDTNKGRGELNVNDNGILFVGDFALPKTGDASKDASSKGYLNGIVSDEKDYAFNVNGGVIVVSGPQLTTDVDMNLSKKATIDTNTGNAYFSGVLKGDGTLVKTGKGTLVLSNANTYKGDTKVYQGELQLNDGGSINNSKNIYLGSSNKPQDKYTSSIPGHEPNDGSKPAKTGPVLKGTLVLNKKENAVLDQTISHLNDSYDDTDGGIIQQGTGTIVLTGNNSYHGDTLVNNGTLRIDGDQTKATGNTNVAGGATLAGNGTLGGNVTVADKAVLAPGASPTDKMNGKQSNLKIKGNLALNSGSTLHINAGQGNTTLDVIGKNGQKTGQKYQQSDSVTVNGNASMQNGSKVNVDIERGSKLRIGQAYRLISTDKGISGNLGEVQTTVNNGNTPYVFLTPSFYFVDGAGVGSNTALDFSLERNDVKFESVAQTHNQHEVGGALDRLPISSDIIQAVSQVATKDEARAAQKALSGELHASLRTALIQDSYYLREAVVNRLAQSFCDDSVASASNISTADLRTHRKTNGRCIKDRPVLWGEAYGSMGNNSGDGNASGLHHSTAGFIMG